MTQYQFIQKHRDQFRLVRMIAVFGVSRSGYYAWAKHCQYCSQSYRKIIDKHQLQKSMSRKGNCWDNVCVESFFHSLKMEVIQYEPLMNRPQMRQTVFRIHLG